MAAEAVEAVKEEAEVAARRTIPTMETLNSPYSMTATILLVILTPEE